MKKKLVSIIILYFVLYLFIIVKSNSFFAIKNIPVFLDNNFIRGDVDADGKINATDYVLIRKYLLNQVEFDNDKLARADINSDNTVNSQDYILIRKVIINGGSPTPVVTPIITPVVTTVPSKEFTATFIVQDEKNIKSNSKELKCTANGVSSCEIVLPSISSSSGYEVIGWNTDKNAQTAILKSGDKTNLSSNVIYYSISRNVKPLTITFIIQNDMAKSSAKSVDCYLYNGRNNCDIITPTLTANKENTTVLGWSSNKDDTKAALKSGGKITIDKNSTYYSITSTLVNITYSVGETIQGVNTKANELSFYNNEHTKCTSYNGNGCNIKWIPTVIAPGKVVHGFAKSSNGDVINVAKTKFKENTTLYARIYDGGEHNIHSINTSHYEIIGNVLVETENGINDNVALKFINFIKDLYRDFPNLLMWNGTISFVKASTQYDIFKEYSNYTIHGAPYSKDFSHIYVFYRPNYYDDPNYYLASCVHEITHAYNYGIYWNGGLNSAISKTDDIVNLYNKYKDASPRPNSDYAYGNASEFYAELVREYYLQHRISKYHDKPYLSRSKVWSADLTSVAEKYNEYGMNYYRSINRIT